MSFDVTIQPLMINIISPNEDEVEPGQDAEIQLLVTIGLILPFQQAPGQPLVAPLGNIRIPFTPGVARDVGAALAHEGEKWPDRPNIDIAQSLQGVDQAQAFEQKIRGG